MRTHIKLVHEKKSDNEAGKIRRSKRNAHKDEKQENKEKKEHKEHTGSIQMTEAAIALIGKAEDRLN